MIGLYADQGINCDPDNFLRGFCCHLFDVHTASLAGHNDDICRTSVRQNGKIQFPGNIKPFLNKQFAYQFSFRTGLWSDQVHVQDLGGNTFDFILGIGKFDTAAFAAATSMDLGFYDNGIVA